MNKDEQFEFSCTILKMTNRAILVDAGLDKDLWIPRSVYTADEDQTMAVDETVEISVPQWFAEKEELV